MDFRINITHGFPSELLAGVFFMGGRRGRKSTEDSDRGEEQKVVLLGGTAYMPTTNKDRLYCN